MQKKIPRSTTTFSAKLGMNWWQTPSRQIKRINSHPALALTVNRADEEIENSGAEAEAGQGGRDLRPRRVRAQLHLRLKALRMENNRLCEANFDWMHTIDGG